MNPSPVVTSLHEGTARSGAVAAAGGRLSAPVQAGPAPGRYPIDRREDRELMGHPDDRPPETFVWRDIDMTAIATPSPYAVAWRVVEHTGITDDGAILYEQAGAFSSCDIVEDIAQAETLIEGHIKWDGCGNLSISPGVMLHLCGHDHVRKFTAVLDRLYEMTAWYVDRPHSLPPAKHWPSQ